MTNEHHHRQFADCGEDARQDGVIPVKYRALLAMVGGAPEQVKALSDAARAAGASEAEIAEAAEIGGIFGDHRPRTSARRAPLRAKGAALWVAVVVAVVLFIPTAPLSWGDGCGDGADPPPVGCSDPSNQRPPWLGAIQRRDPQFADSYRAMRERILKDGAIPAKYKFLMAMVTDAIAAHPDGVRMLAGNARAAGASEPEVTEAVEVGYLFGGTAALVIGSNAFNG